MSELGDIFDRASAQEAAERKALISERRRVAQAIPTGEPGTCDLCGEWSGRLVQGVCAPCRDRYRLG